MSRALSPLEEVELRRVAHGSVMVDARIADRLRAVALVEDGPGGLRLTPLGRRRYDSLPSAPLLKPQGAIPGVASYIDVLLERAGRRGRKSEAVGRRASPEGPSHS